MEDRLKKVSTGTEDTTNLKQRIEQIEAIIASLAEVEEITDGIAKDKINEILSKFNTN